MPTDSSPPAVWPNRTQPSPVSGSGWRSGRGTAANPTWAASPASWGAPTCPWPDWPEATMTPSLTSTKARSWLASRTRPAASSDGRSSSWSGGGSSYWAAPMWKASRWPPSTQSRGTQETAVTEDSMRTAATDATGWRARCPAPHRARSAEQVLEELADPFGPVHDQVGRVQQLGRGLLGADRDPQPAAGLGGDGEGGQVAEVVAGHHQAAGAGLGGHPADGGAFVAADLGAQLPHHPPGHHLQAVGGRDPLGGLADRAGPAGRVGDPAGVDGDRVALVLQVGAALEHRRVGGQVPPGRRDRRPGRPQGPGRRRVLDDRGDGAVEVQADGHLGGPPGQPGGVGGHGPGAGHGRPPAGAGRRGGRLVPVASLALVSLTARAGSRPALASTNVATSSGHGPSQLRSTQELALGTVASRSPARSSSSSATAGHHRAAPSALASRVQATRASRRDQGLGSPASSASSRRRPPGSRATSGPSTFMPRWSVVSQLSSRPVQASTRLGSVAARAARSRASRKQATSCSSRIPVFQSRSARPATWPVVAPGWARSHPAAVARRSPTRAPWNGRLVLMTGTTV